MLDVSGSQSQVHSDARNHATVHELNDGAACERRLQSTCCAAEQCSQNLFSHGHPHMHLAGAQKFAVNPNQERVDELEALQAFLVDAVKVTARSAVRADVSLHHAHIFGGVASRR